MQMPPWNPPQFRGRAAVHCLFMKSSELHEINSGLGYVRHFRHREHMRRQVEMAKQISIAAVVAICISLMTLTPQPVWGQAVYGSILGTVTDPQGAAVANAKVTVTNQRKGTSDTTTTNADGNYSVTHLIPDIYTVRAEGAGF
ncbi:MAG: hypothetical protein DMG80_06560 [Acidobacteria bacterium]|nr:MAG: hypothetical protein DMG80_06560 [Acidobacteriota bacterium]